MARLHNACDDFASDQPRFALDLVHLLDHPLATFEPFLRDRPDDDRYLRALVAVLRGRVEAAASDLRWQACHGDLHGGNTHRQPDGSLVFFDFDSCGMGYAAYEIAVFRWGSIFREPDKAEQRWERFLEGTASSMTTSDGWSSGARSTCRVRRRGHASARSSGTADRPLPPDADALGARVDQARGDARVPGLARAVVAALRAPRDGAHDLRPDGRAGWATISWLMRRSWLIASSR